MPKYVVCRKSICGFSFLTLQQLCSCPTVIFNFKNLSKRDKSKKDVSFLDMSFLNISSFLDMSFLTRLQTRLSSYKKQMILQNLPTVQHKRIMLPHCSRVSYCDACVKNGSRSFCSFFFSLAVIGS